MVTSIRKFYLSRKYALPQELQLRFLQQLHYLLTNGYPLIDGLEVITWDKQLKKTANIIIKALKKGSSIDQSFEEAHFHQTIVAQLYFIRKSGDVVSSLRKCADLFAKRIEHTKKLYQISRYPLILLTIFIVLLFMIKKFILPSFASFNTSQENMSFPLKISFALLNHIETIILIGCIVSVLLFIIWRLVFRQLRVESQISFCKYIPIYRKILALQISFQFATHLSALLKTDLSLKDILNNMSQQKRMPIIRYYTSLMVDELNKGKYVTELLTGLDFLEKQFSVIFQKNKDRRALEKDLAVYAELLIDELQRKFMKITSVIQPLFFIFLACFVILVYLTLMLPMFDLIKAI